MYRIYFNWRGLSNLPWVMSRWQGRQTASVLRLMADIFSSQGVLICPRLCSMFRMFEACRNSVASSFLTTPFPILGSLRLTHFIREDAECTRLSRALTTTKPPYP